MKNKEMIQTAIDEIVTGTVIHSACVNGVVAIVEDRGTIRIYHAREFSNGELCGGYSTAEKHWYMGERYKDKKLWGTHFNDVFGGG